jgi:hypothetical protein
MQLLEDEEIEDQNSVEGNQDTSKDEETTLDNALQI